MERQYTKSLWNEIIPILAFLCLAGCETVPNSLPDPDDPDGPTNNKDINMVDTIYAKGLKGFLSEGKNYTEFTYTDDITSKHKRIKGMRKGTAAVEGNIESVQWEATSPVITYGGGGNSAISYSYKGLKTEVVTNDNQHAETVINTYGDGRMHSQLSYTYNSAGYLTYVRIERPGQEAATVAYKYPDLLNPTDSDKIIIEEYPGLVYHIPLAVNKNVPGKLKNESYICNVLREGKAPLTNEYVINPDLYYLGIYGTPYKYLPDETIESVIGGGQQTSLFRVGNIRYYYY
jgi:hypothetical protein